MAKEKKDDKAKVRVFFAEIEGDNETIRDGLRSIAEAVNRTFQPETRVVKVITSSSSVNQNQLPEEAEEQIIDIESQDAQESTSDEEKPKSKPSRPKKSPSYSFIKDLNLRPSGKQSLRDFYAEKNPADQQQILTTVLHYLQHIIELDNVTVNHLYTALKDLSELGVRVPTNIAQRMRDISNRKNWVDSSKTDSLKMTTTGDNFVEHDLPATKTKKS